MLEIDIIIHSMLTFVTAKFLLSGAIKSLIVEPVMTKISLTMVPQINIVHFSLVGKDLTISTGDLVKFGLDKLYQRFGEEELSFQIDRMQNHIYQIVPANELAARFFKEYGDVDELLVDLDAVDQYLDLLYEEDLKTIDDLEFTFRENEEAIMQILTDLDTSVKLAKKNQFCDHQTEQQLIDAILEKNIEIINKAKSKLVRTKQGPQSAIDEILEDFPSTPRQIISDEEQIELILQRLGSQVDQSPVKHRQKIRSIEF